MARTETTVELDRNIHRYFWPLPFLNFWLLVMWATAVTQITVFALFMTQQAQFEVGSPWLFPYGVTVGALTVVFLVWINIQMATTGLVPEPVWVLTFVFFALYLTGLIGTSIQLFGAGGVSGHCHGFVQQQEYHGANVLTLAYLEQNSICQSWYASFAFWIVGVVFLVWLFVMAFVVKQTSVDRENRYRGIDD